MKNKKLFREYMVLLGEIHNRELSDLLLDAYWKILEPFSDDACKKSFDQLIAISKFFPKPPDFLEILRGTIQDTAVLAWEKVDSTVKSHGPYVSVKFDDDVIHSCIELMGGWVALCNEDIKNWHWKQKEFVQLYATLSKKNIHPEYLPGIVEKENGPRGLKFPSPVLIGDKKLELMKGG